MQPLVSIVISTRNRKDMLDACLQSLLCNTYKNIEIIVVDDASTDGTSDMLRAKYPQAKLLRNETAIFATCSRNKGCGIASGDFYLLVDDDNEVDQHMIEELVKLCESNPRIGMAGPKMYYHGEDNLLLFTGATIHPITSKPVYRGANTFDTGQYDQPADTEHIPNIQIIRKEVFLKMGGFDERYRMTYSEADLPKRAAEAGYSIVYCPAAITYHKVPRPRSGAASASSFIAPMRAYYLARNRVLYMKRFSTGLQFLLFFCVFYPLYSVYYAAGALKTRNYASLRLHLWGSFHGFVYGLTGSLRDYYASGLSGRTTA